MIQFEAIEVVCLSYFRPFSECLVWLHQCFLLLLELYCLKQTLLLLMILLETEHASYSLQDLVNTMDEQLWARMNSFTGIGDKNRLLQTA